MLIIYYTIVSENILEYLVFLNLLSDNKKTNGLFVLLFSKLTFCPGFI